MSGIANVPDQLRRVLVVEDTPVILKVVRHSLRHAGFSVTTANDGAAAWELLLRNDFDLVITDLQMPVMTGLELCEAIRKDLLLKHMPVILLTAKTLGSAETYFRATFRIGAIVPKPFSLRALRQVAEGLLASGAAEAVG